MNAPTAPQRPHVHDRHGHQRPDPWFWLRERKDPEVLAYIEAENAYTQAALARVAPLRAALYADMLGRIQETDASAPVRRGAFLYYSRTVAGLAYPIHCRKPADRPDAPEQVLLDVNDLAVGHEFTSLGCFEVSPNHELAAYAVDHTGSELYELRFRDLATGRDLPDVLEGIWPDVCWANDNATVLYTTLDAALRPYRLNRHALGTPRESDAVVLEESDERFRISCHRTRSGGFVVVDIRSSLTSETHLLAADRPTSPLRCVQPRHHGMRYSVDHHPRPGGDRLIIVTNDADDAEGKHTEEAVNRKVMEAPVDATSKLAWTELIAHRPEVEVRRAEVFARHLVVLEREGGLPRIRIRRWADGAEHLIEVSEPAYELTLARNEELDTDQLRFEYTALNRPDTTYRYDMASRERTVLKVQPVLGSFDPEDYVVERIFAPATDGVRVPISLVYRKGGGPGKNTPFVLYGYGSYGITIPPTFASTRLCVLDRGIGFAIAHVRGGGAMGKPWHDAAKFKGKRNTFEDFVACAEHLIGLGYTSPDRLGIMGGSAGGLLMGAVINLRPELFRACVAQVPFVDVVTTMLDESLPLTANEWEEWGDPRQADFYEYMLSYSPFDNVRDVKYPDLLVTSGLNDPRVQYWEPTKWVAKLRATVSDPNRSLVLLKTHMGAGHQGKSGRYGYLEDRAYDFAFLLDRLGVGAVEDVGEGAARG